MKLKARFVLFDKVNKNNNVIPKDCKIDIPEKIPVLWDFDRDKVIGVAEVLRDDAGLVAKVETIDGSFVINENLKTMIENGEIGAGGYYNGIEYHEEDELLILDEAKLSQVSMTLDPVREEYLFEIADEN